jgi:Spy/CpxP family protein refolding chaperone
MARHLDLTPEQEAKVRELHGEMRSGTEALREKVRNLKDEMRKEWRQEVPDAATILELQKEMHEVKGELAEHRIRFRLDVAAILTPEQREKARARLMEGRGRGKGKGQGGKFRGEKRGFGAGGPGYRDEAF